ncbi:MAG TPA: hypothetical protein VEU77_07590 [Candidatus Acidoferrales bacterium]|nr:hypothetical protein [Candidatus Acidoferrales bacterium]
MRYALIATLIAAGCTPISQPPTASQSADAPPPASSAGPTRTATPTSPPPPTSSPIAAYPIGGRTFAASDTVVAWVADSFAPDVQHRATVSMHVTIDGGRSWIVVSPPPGALYITEIKPLGATQLWIIGWVPTTPDSTCAGVPPPPCSGTIFRSVDAGRSWSSGAAEPEVRHALASGLSHLTAVDSLHAWATTSHGCQDLNCATDVVATTDGRVWSTLGTLPDLVHSIDFVDALHGWATTLHRASIDARPDAVARLYATDDGGRTWTPLFHATGVSPQLDVDFVDAERGWMLGDDQSTGCTMGGCADYTFYQTTDGGRTWVVEQSPESQPLWSRISGQVAGAGFLGALQFSTASEGWIGVGPGAGPSTGGVLHTTDGGRTWSKFVDDFAWTDTQVYGVRGGAWARVTLRNASSESIFWTSDGITWRQVTPP